MFRIIWKDVRNMLRRPLVFLLLFVGLVVGGFSLLVYYVSSSQELKVSRQAAGVDNVVEAAAQTGDVFEIQRFMEFFESGNFPEVEFASAISYEYEDYDVVGLYWHQEGEVAASYKGSFLDASMMGLNKAVASADIFGDREAELGERIKIKGQPYEIVGLVSAYGGYMPELYDARRLKMGTEDVAGVELDRTWQAELKDRPDRVVIIPLDTFEQRGLTSSYYHITFKEELTAAQRRELETRMVEKVGVSGCTDMTQFIQINRINHLSKVLVYFAAIAAGIINIVSLFAFFLKENRRQYVAYRVMGATGGQIAAIVITELALYTLAAFSIGCAGAVPFIEYSGFVGVHMPYGFFDFLFLYLALLGVEVLICLGQIRILTGQTMTRLRGGAEERDRPERKAGEDRVGGMKFAYLLTFRYNRKNIVRTVSIAFLTLVTAFSLAYAMTYVFVSGRYTRYGAKAFPDDVLELMYHNNEFYFQQTDWVQQSGKSYLSAPGLRELEERMQELEGVKGLGRATTFHTFFYGERMYFANEVNRAFAENAPVLLKKGSWEALAQYDAADESAVIPVIVPPYLEKEFPLGTRFSMEYRFVVGQEESGDGTGTYTILSDNHMREFEVAGVIDEASFSITTSDQMWDEVLFVTDHLEDLYDDTLVEKEGKWPTPLYMPEVLHNGEHDARNMWLPSYYLFPEREGKANMDAWNEAVTEYGKWESFDDCIAEYVENFQAAGGNIYFMHAAVASALLILGVGGYSIMLFAANRRMYGIYYVCGMPWSKAAGLTVAGNALDMLLPAAVGAVAGVYAARGIRVFDNATIALSVLTGVGAVLALYALTSAIIALSMRKARPKQLMAADGR